MSDRKGGDDPAVGDKRFEPRDEIARVNETWWNHMVETGFHYTKPWLDLDPDVLRDYAAGRIEVLPREWI